MPPAGFEPAISASKRLQTHALDRADTVIGSVQFNRPKLNCSTIFSNDCNKLSNVYLFTHNSRGQFRFPQTFQKYLRIQMYISQGQDTFKDIR
jgi:hypothetical protein